LIARLFGLSQGRVRNDYPFLFIFLTDSNGSIGHLCDLMERVGIMNRSRMCHGMQIARKTAKILRMCLEKASKMKETSGFANEIRNAGRWLIGTRREHARCVGTLAQ
jgi:hypothetical protein